jgi:hypothetical protein
VKLQADFNGLFGEILCLSHEDTALDERGNRIALAAGMSVTAFEPDTDEHGEPDELLASGVVEPAPDWLACRGSRWILRMDARGVRYANDEKA